MFVRKTSEPPLTFEQVLANERKALRSGQGPDTDSTKLAEPPLSALCISGGGIRSATFALGVLQGLAEQGVLSSFDYLSTVSGGGYIGSWLTAWKQRQGGLEKIVPALLPAAPFPPKDDPDPLQHLREYNNYLSPKLGLFSADTWTLVATVARNILLNWLVLVPLFMFVLTAPRLVLSLARWGEALKAANGPLWAHQTQLTYLLARLAGLAFAIAVFNTLRYLPGVGKTNHTEANFLKYCLGPVVCAVLLFITMESWFTGGDQTGPTDLTFRTLLIWISSACGLGWVAYLLLHARSMWRRYRLIAALTATLALTCASIVCCAWLLVSRFYPEMGWETYVTLAPPLLLLALMLPVVLFVGLTSSVLEDEDREWLSRAGAWMLLSILFWTGLCSLVLFAPEWALNLGAWGSSAFAAAGGAGGVLTALGGFSLKSKVPRKSSNPGQEEDQPLASKFMGLVLQLAAATFVVIFVVGLAMLTNWLLSVLGLVPGDWTDHWPFLENSKTRWVAAASAVFLAFAWGMARFININKFSLHAMYRNRLIRAYMGASSRAGKVNKFTGFSIEDDMPMHQLDSALRPFHVVNVTLNLVSGKRLAWQQRKAEAFTFSPLHCGSSELGYRPSQEYARGISLGTAMALSGAAASPNMGYYSSPTVGLIMTLFNARLGAWLGNPGDRGARTWTKPGPDSAVASIVREAFGLTNEHCPYVYLSDGGHFENLGIYEMVKRGCRFIVVLDGAADGDLKFADLGNALRKIRIDTKIDIKFDEHWVQSLRDRTKRWALARICYQAAGKGEDGFLIYVKPLMCGTEPPDVVSYQASHTEFPHESTANQFFDESQTESYRMLGLHTVREMLAGWDKKGMPSLAEHVRAAQVGTAVKQVRAAEAGG
jgi:Patatin-like phospholipase